MQSSILFVVSSILMAGSALAEVSFNSTNDDYGFKGVIPAGSLSSDCAAAYSEKLQCSDMLFKMRNDTKGPELFTANNLKDLCTSDCIDSLNNWDKKMNEKCTSNDKVLLEDPTGSAEYFNMVLRNKHAVQENLYWAFCLKDGDDYCLIKDNLPEWPTGSDTAKISDFCKSECRVTQSYLVNQAAAESGTNSTVFDATKGCMGIDVSSFAMNAQMFKAFGVSKENSTHSASTNGKLAGTGYNYTLYNGKTVGGSANSSSSGGSDDKEGAAVTAATARSLWTVAGLAAVVAMLA